MKKLNFLALILASVSVASVSFADDWASRATCDNGALTIDGLHSYSHGFINHQVVIRDANAVKYLTSLTGGSAKANSNGEFVVNLNTKEFDGSFDAVLGFVYPNGQGGSGQRYSLRGSYSNGNYEVQVTRLSVYPGMSYHEPSVEGNWVFHNCR